MCAVFRPLSKLPTITLTNEVILCLVWFGFGRNKLVQLLILSRNSGGRTGQSLLETFSELMASIHKPGNGDKIVVFCNFVLGLWSML